MATTTPSIHAPPPEGTPKEGIPSRDELIYLSETIPEQNFTTCLRLWELLILSLPLDLLVFIYPSTIFHSLASWVFGISISVSVVVLLFREKLVQRSVQLKDLQMNALARKRWLPYAVIGIFLSFTFIETLLKFGSVHRGSVILAGIVAFLSVGAFIKALKQRSKDIDFYLSNWGERMRVGNSLTYTASVIGLAASRLVSLSGWYLAAEWPTGILMSILGVSLLFSVRPHKEQFFFLCPHCGKMTSRALGVSNKCAFCQNSWDVH